MAKKGGRSIRSSLEEKIQTPSQKHFHYFGRKDNLVVGEFMPQSAETKRKQRLLEMFKEREKTLAKNESKKERE